MTTLTPEQVADLRRKADEQALDPLTTQLPLPCTVQPAHWSYNMFCAEEEEPAS